MATPKKDRNKDIVVNKDINVVPAEIVTQDQKRGADIDLPEFLKDDNAFTKEASDGFSPVIDFRAPGNWIIARYVGLRPNIGPNKSTMYDFEVTNPDKTTTVAALWGSTILDNKMLELLRGSNPMKPGDLCFIQYLGVVDTQRGLNPAKDYRLRVVNPEFVKGMYK